MQRELRRYMRQGETESAVRNSVLWSLFYLAALMAAYRGTTLAVFMTVSVRPVLLSWELNVLSTIEAEPSLMG